MANGDTAAAAGLSTMNPVRDIRLGADDINLILDGLVNWLGRGGGNPLPISKGGTGANSASGARTNLGIDRIQNQTWIVAVDNDGRVYSNSLRDRQYQSAGQGTDANRLMVLTSSGTLGTLIGKLPSEYLPSTISVDGDVNAGGKLTADDDIICAGSKGRVTSYGALHIDSSGKLGTVASAAKYKDDVELADLDVEQLLKVEPKRFTLKGDPTGEVQLGFIADDFEPIAPQLVIHGEDGEVEGLHYERVTVALHAIARSLAGDVEQLKADLATERRRSDQLDRRTRWLYTHVTGQELPAEEEENRA